MTKKEQDSLLALVATPNGQAMIGGRQISGVLVLRPTVVRWFETLGFVERVNPAWCQITNAGRAEAEHIESGRVFRVCERYEREARR